MTFNESEHMNILEKLFEFSEQELPLDRVIKETRELNRRIPLYPGLVLNCLNSIIENISQEDVNVGDQIVITQNNEIISGIVSEKLSDEFVLEEVKITKKLDSFNVKLKGEKKLIRLKSNVLEELWPSLMFDKGGKIPK